jgi:hypothetical protein
MERRRQGLQDITAPAAHSALGLQVSSGVVIPFTLI